MGGLGGVKEAYYFSHDSNARHDPKITAMRSVYGAAGYGWFWILVEMMRDTAGYRLDMQSKYIWSAYAQQMGCNDAAQAKQFVMDCIEEFELFQADDCSFWSKSLIGRMEKREKIVEKRRKAAETRWGKYNDLPEPEDESLQMHDETDANAYEDYANAMQVENDAMQVDASMMQTDAKESKGKESKGNKNKGNIKDDMPDGHTPKQKYSDFVFLTDDEYKKLSELLGDELEDYFVRFGSWLSGQTTRVQNSRSAYLTIRNWHREDQKKRGVKSAVDKGRTQGVNTGIDFGF
jgi:hypothetical protein